MTKENVDERLYDLGIRVNEQELLIVLTNTDMAWMSPQKFMLEFNLHLELLRGLKLDLTMMCGSLAFGKLLRINEAMKVGTCPLAFYKRKRSGLGHSVWPVPSRNPHQMQPPVSDLSAFRTMKSISFYSLNQSWYYYSSRKWVKTTYSGNQREDQQSKGTCHQTSWLEFNSRGPNGRRREPAPASCPVTS